MPVRSLATWARVLAATLTVALGGCSVPGAARCGSDNECGPGQACRSGDCVTQCNNTLDCSRLQRCQEGVCVTDPSLGDAGVARSSSASGTPSGSLVSGDPDPTDSSATSGNATSSSATEGSGSPGSSSGGAVASSRATGTPGFRLVPAAGRMEGQRYRVVGRFTGGAETMRGGGFVMKARWVGGAP